jgi:hypothetical protein
MKKLFVTAFIALAHSGFAAETPVSAESFLSKSGELSFKLQNYSKDTGYDCVLSYDLRTYDEDHAFLRTAVNLQTKKIFLDKGSVKRVKADFELQENEKIAELAHSVSVPKCEPALKSRAVALKDYYKFNYVEKLPASKNSYPFGGDVQGIILRADFKDISEFEISASKEVNLGQKMNFMGGFNQFFNPETFEIFFGRFQLAFMNDGRRNVMLTTVTQTQNQNVITTNTEGHLFYFNKKSKTIEKFTAEAGEICGALLGTDYLMCSKEKEPTPKFINPSTKETLDFDSTAEESLKDFNKDLEKCAGSYESMMSVQSEKLFISSRCSMKETQSLERFDVVLEKDTDFYKFVSYNNVDENNMKVAEIHKDFPWAAFMIPVKPDPIKNRYLSKETLNASVERILKKKVYGGATVIRTGKEEYFDVFFIDTNNNAFFGRIYWNDL